MKRPILYAALCLSGTALAQDTTYFKQDFEDYRLRTWAEHNDSTNTTADQALPHVKFNRIRGGHPARAFLDTTLAGIVLENRSLEVFIPDSTRNQDGTMNQDGTTGDLPRLHFGRSVSYYFGGRIVRGDENNLWPTGTSRIYDSYVPDNDEMYLRYHVKLENGWKFDRGDLVKIPGLAGTYNAGAGGHRADPDQGKVGWSARMTAGRGPRHSTDEWSPLSYVYHLDQKGETGDHYPYHVVEGKRRRNWDVLPRLQMNRWYRIEQRIKMNDPGKSNGLTEVWINGTKNDSLSKYGLKYTTSDTIGINRVWADIHYGGKYLSPADNTLFLDDFHVSTGPTPWSGELVGHSEWSGTILVTGDVTVPAGIYLTITAGTEIRFAANSDETWGGEDPARSELIVRGNLTTVGGGITFRSSNTTDPSHDDWYGIRVKSLGVARLTDVTVRDAVHCEQAGTGGLLFSTGVTLTNCGQVPLAPGNLKAADRNRAVRLTWDTPAANNGSPITGYEYRQSTDGGTTWPPDWTEISPPADTEAADLEEHTVTGLTNGTAYTFEVRAVNEAGEGASAQASLPPVSLQAGWVLDGPHLLANHKARLTWDDPGDSHIVGWDYQQKTGNAAWEDWQEIPKSSATTVTYSVEKLNLLRTYRFKVRARYWAHSGAEPEVVLSPPWDVTQKPDVIQNSGDGQFEIKMGLDLPVDVDLPDGLVPNEFLQFQVTKTTAAGVTTESGGWRDLKDITKVLPEAELTSIPFPGLPPREISSGEKPVGGRYGARRCNRFPNNCGDPDVGSGPWGDL